jgi:hypothetical protein
MNWESKAGRAILWSILLAAVVLPLDYIGGRGVFTGPLDRPRALSEMLLRAPIIFGVAVVVFYLIEVMKKRG